MQKVELFLLFYLTLITVCLTCIDFSAYGLSHKLLTPTLKHSKEFKPHLEQVVVAHELDGDGSVRQDVVQIRHQRPVTVLLHHLQPAVHDVVKVLGRI